MVLVSKKRKVKLSLLKKLSLDMYGALIKGVVDIEREVMIIGGQLHADEESVLLSKGSKQNNLWGINLYPEKYPDKSWIEIDSIINLRPSQNNLSRTVEDKGIKDKIIEVVSFLVEDDTP